MTQHIHVDKRPFILAGIPLVCPSCLDEQGQNNIFNQVEVEMNEDETQGKIILQCHTCFREYVLSFTIAEKSSTQGYTHVT